jgi:hypothetical protein
MLSLYYKLFLLKNEILENILWGFQIVLKIKPAKKLNKNRPTPLTRVGRFYHGLKPLFVYCLGRSSIGRASLTTSLRPSIS